MITQINLLGYITIKGVIRCLTGIHVGGSADSIDKGGIDSPVIRNPVTNEPYIPGSSLRGRMRCILEKALKKSLDELVENIWIHIGKDEDDIATSEVCRIFGTSKKECTIPSALIVRDCLLSKSSREKYMDGRLPVTEAKMETAIDRVTSGAHPRTIERVPSGAEFEFELVYKVQSGAQGNFDESDNQNVKEDIEKLLWALEIIEKHDGLGGHTARGYGQVKFIVTNLDAKKVDIVTPAFEKKEGGFEYTLKDDDSDKTDYNILKSKYVNNICFHKECPQVNEETKTTNED
jgi:CRISPR-associated protein Csm3